MSTNGSSENLLLQITLCNTPEPCLNRMLSVPSQMTFTELHEAIGVAFGWNTEPCTSWVFKRMDQNPLKITKRDNSKSLKTTFSAFWMAVGQGYTPAQYMDGTQVGVGQHMNTAQAKRYWTYDYNISNQPHMIKVIGTLTDDPKLKCLGGLGYVDRNLWQSSGFIGLASMVKSLDRNLVCDVAALNAELQKVQERFEERKRLKATVAVDPKDSPKKRTASAESGITEAEENPVKKLRGTIRPGPGKSR